MGWLSQRCFTTHRSFSVWRFCFYEKIWEDFSCSFWFLIHVARNFAKRARGNVFKGDEETKLDQHGKFSKIDCSCGTVLGNKNQHSFVFKYRAQSWSKEKNCFVETLTIYKNFFHMIVLSYKQCIRRFCWHPIFCLSPKNGHFVWLAILQKKYILQRKTKANKTKLHWWKTDKLTKCSKK